jgi:lipoprotein-releasing system permease protein
MNTMSFAWFIARRYLTARRRQAFISLISAVSTLGVAVGVMALIIALALMTGVQGELRDRIVGSTAHIYVYKTAGEPFRPLDEELRKLRVAGVRGAAPAVLGVAMIVSSNGEPAFVRLKGIDPSIEREVTDIDTAMRTGIASSLMAREDDDHILLGVDLARTLGVTVGDDVLLMTPQAIVTPSMSMPRQRRMTVSGTFEYGLYEYDSGFALVSLEAGASLLDSDGPGLIQLRVDDLDEAPAIRRVLESQLGAGYVLEDWTKINAPLYSALWLEKVAISLTIGLIVIVAALNIVASLILLVMEKSRDIAILRTMGASAPVIRRIFVLQGLTIGLVGTTAGTVLGVVACYVLDRYELIRLSAEVYQITHLKFTVLPLDVLTVVGSAILVCYLATLYPARQAGRLDPAEALRNQ